MATGLESANAQDAYVRTWKARRWLNCRAWVSICGCGGGGTFNRNGTYPMPTRAAILANLGLPHPKPYEFEPLPGGCEEPSIKIGLEGHGAVVVDVESASRLANATRINVPDRADQIDACIEQAARHARDAV